MSEIELKFLLAATDLRRLRARIKGLPGLQAAPSVRVLRSVYFDTSRHALRQSGIALRMRRDGRAWIQTVKAKASRHGGLQSVAEAEAPAPAGRLNVNLIPDAGLRDRVADVVRDAALAPVCETAIRRTLAVWQAPGGGRVEIALDQGDVIAGDRSAALCELELELKSGGVGMLFDLAKALLPEGGIGFSRMSKADRGYLLAADGVIDRPVSARNAVTVPLAPAQSSETAARDVLRECFEQITANVDAVRAVDDPEGPHQLRIGLRRLRSAFAVFKPVLGNAEMARLNGEARWLGQLVGGQRDLDVAIVDLIAPEARAHPHEPGLASLDAALRARADANRAGLRDALTAARVHDFVFDLGRFIEARGWLMPDDIGQTARLARPVEALAADALSLAWRKTCRRAEGIETLSIEARHDLRKDLKKLRYAIEFFAPVLPAKRVTAFVKRLKALQQVFGDLNDAAMAEALFRAPDAPGAGDPEAQRAVGWLLGSRMARAEAQWSHAKGLWTDLARSRPCW